MARWAGRAKARMRDGALPSPANQALVLSGVVEAANAESWKVNLIEVFDQPWKRLLEGAVGGYRGLFGDYAAAEVPLGRASVQPPRMADRGGAWHLRRVSRLRHCLVSRRKDDADEAGWGQSLAIAAPSLSAGLVFGCAALGLPMEPPEPGDRLRSAGMIVLSLLVRQSMSGSGSSSIPATRIFNSPCSQDP